jgi:hypothetical protein
MTRLLSICVAAFAWTAVTAGAESDYPPSPVGTAVVDITPSYPIRLTGYASRTKESEGIETRLKAKALALGSNLLIAVDNCGVPGPLADEVVNRLREKTGLSREMIVIASTHTHCAPWVTGGIPYIFGGPLPADQRERVERYGRELSDALVKVGMDALADRKPAKMAWAQGSVGFATNRRMIKDGRWTGFGANPNGPVDRSLPVLRVTDTEGKVRAVLTGYACHCTTLGGDYNKICAEWAGYACDELERTYPGAVALVVIGCGADADPQPRLTLENTRKHGAAVAGEVKRVLAAPMISLPGRITSAYTRTTLPLQPAPSRAEFANRARRPGPEGYFARGMLERLERGEALPKSVDYPIQTWCFGDSLAMVFLGGEVVVDYALRLKRECRAGRLWVVAYSNEMPCYIASKRIVSEGGYEADSSMIYYGQPAQFTPEVEDRLIATVHGLLLDSFQAPKP